jgi:S-formylglutathione hydrolase FrmB
MMEFYSPSLRRNAEFRFILPDDVRVQEMFKDSPSYKRPAKTVYLLNGYTNSGTEWLLGGGIRYMADFFNLAMILPNGENSFYTNGPGTGRRFGDYIGIDLVNFTRKRFGLSGEREDTFIGGISMGGYGALRNGFAYPDTFSKIIAMSPAYIIHEINKAKPGFENAGGNYDYYYALFGNLDTVMESENSVEHLINTIEAEDKAKMPQVYHACGTEDFLYDVNKILVNYMKAHNVLHEYHEGPGKHDFDFWNQYIKKSFSWAVEEE